MLRSPPSASPSLVEERHPSIPPYRRAPLRWSRSATLRYRRARSPFPLVEKRHPSIPPSTIPFPAGRGAPSERSEHDASRDHRNMTLEIHTQHRVTTSRGSSPSGSSHLDDRGKGRPLMIKSRSAGLLMPAERAPFPLEPAPTNTTSTGADHRPRKSRFSGRFRGSYIRTGPTPSTGSPRLEAPRLAARRTSTTDHGSRPEGAITGRPGQPPSSAGCRRGAGWGRRRGRAPTSAPRGSW